MTSAEDRPFASLQVGDTATFECRIPEDDVRAFADLSGDQNPLHMDDAYARATPFGGRVVHGMLLGGLVSRLIGMQLPGKRALLLKESLEFKKPVRIEDTVKVEGEIVRASLATHIIEVEIHIYVEGAIVATGNAHVQVRDE